MASRDRGHEPPTNVTDPAAADERSRRRDQGGSSLVALGEQRDQALVRRFTLLVTVGQDAGEKFVSTAERMVIGTHPSCDVVLHDPTVSRFHCEITVAGKSALVRDLESSNETLVDNQPVHLGFLRGGAVIELGRSQLRFDTGGEPVKIPLSPEDRFGTLVGGSATMRRVFAELERAATTDASVLFEGEPGTGKASAVRSLHAHGLGERRGGPLITVDCAGAKSADLEDELFGDDGAYALARGGAVHLHEVADVPIDLQPRVAAAIDAHRGQVRTFASSRRSLQLEVNGRRCRSELYQKVAAIHIRMPPLRDRPGDLPLLIDTILARTGDAARPDAARLRTPACHLDLGRRALSGNVAELEALIARTLLPRRGSRAPAVAASEDFTAARSAWVAIAEREAVERALAAHPGDRAGAIRATGLDHLRFGELLRRYGLT